MIAESSYNEKISRVENQIILRLRDRLAAARNAHEMFRIFSKFNNLFIRPKVRCSVVVTPNSADAHYPVSSCFRSEALFKNIKPVSSTL